MHNNLSAEPKLIAVDDGLAVLDPGDGGSGNSRHPHIQLHQRSLSHFLTVQTGHERGGLVDRHWRVWRSGDERFKGGVSTDG